MKRILLAFALLANCASYGAAVLTNVADVARALAGKQTGARYELTAQVVSRNTSRKSPIVVQDASGCVLMYLSNVPDTPPAVGDVISVRGRLWSVAADLLMPFASAFKVLRHGVAPPPVEATHDDIYSGKLAYHIVRLRGIVIDAFQDEADARYSFLVLSMDGKPIGLPTEEIPYERLARLIGAEISVIGACNPYRGHGPRAKLEYEVHIGSESNLTVLTPPPADPFDVPGFAGDVYSVIFPKIGDTLRRKVVGRVEAIGENRLVFVRTGEGELSSVRLKPDVPPPETGRTIEAVGIAETDFYSLNLARAIWRAAETPAAIEAVRPVAKSVRDIFLDPDRGSRFNNALIGHVLKVRGTVLNLERKPEGRGIIHLREGDENLTVDGTAVPHALDGLEDGTQVEVTGLCVAKTDNWRPQSPFPHIDEMRLVLRAPDDVTVLVSAPWWTPARLQLAIAILISVILFFFAYSSFLTRIIRRRDEALNRERQANERTEIRRFERTRLAIELHDSLVQILTGAAMELETARKVGADDPAATSAHLKIAEKALRSCREELRNSIWDLRSDALEEATLERAILRTLTPHVSKARIAVKFEVRREILSDNTCHAVIRIIRELTLNAANHGKAHLIRIAGKVDGGTLYFSVIDDGCGFNVADRPGVLEGHFGLQGVKERVTALGGGFTLSSTPGHGTKARVTIPLEPEQPE